MVCEPDALERETALEALTVRAPKTVGTVALRNVNRDHRPVWARMGPSASGDGSARTATYAHLLAAVH